LVRLINFNKYFIFSFLEIRIASKKYIRFQKVDQQQLDNRKIDELLTTIQATISTDISLINHSVIIQSNPIEKPIITWTGQDIINWFDENNISRNIYNMYEFQTGIQLLMYKQYIQDDWKKQYERYSPRYEKKYHSEQLTEHDFIKFVTAIQQLPSLQNKSNQKYNRKKYFNCIIL